VKEERTQLSEERMRLIRRFMSESADEEDDAAEQTPAAVDEPPQAEAPVPAPPPIRAPEPVLTPAIGSSRSGSRRVLLPSGSERLPGSLAASLRGYGGVAWPLAAVVLGLVLALLIAHSA
jgi:hypothetical protein